MIPGEQEELSPTDLTIAAGLLQRWAQAFRGGMGVGYPSINIIAKARARAHGTDDPPPVSSDDLMANQVNEALNEMRRKGLGGPFEVALRYYLPWEPISMKAVGKGLNVSEGKAWEWHSMALCYVLARVDI